jgi:predicted DNA-binding transcriptional regulator YafY
MITEEKMGQTHPPLQDFINKMAERREVHKVVIEMERDIVKYLGEQKYYNGFVRQEPAGDYEHMTFLTGSLTGFARWFMLFGDKATILEPLELNDIISDIARNILKKVQKSKTLLT